MEWTKGRDIIKFEYEDRYDGYEFTVACNHDSWEDSKAMDGSHPLYLSCKQGKSKIFIGLSVEDVTKLKNYLEQKIDYLIE